MRPAYLILALFPAAACNSEVGGGPGADGGAGGADAGGTDATPADASAAVDASRADASPDVPQYSELWYSVDDRLVYVEIDSDDGSVVRIEDSVIENPPPLGQNMLTMVEEDGSLFGGRLSKSDNLTYFYHVEEPPRDGSSITVTELGVMDDELMLEGLYTDCDGRLYGMDTGVDDTSAEGNRLLRFTGDPLSGDFSYAVVSDLATADVADIDDMGPSITGDGEIADNPGLAIDTGDIYDFDFETGSGTAAGGGGTFGIHALGGPLFSDDVPRLYVLDSDGELYEMDPDSYELSESLGTGPTDVDGSGGAGWSSLAGPLTDCDSGFDLE